MSDDLWCRTCYLDRVHAAHKEGTPAPEPLLTREEAAADPEVRRLVFGLTPDEYYLGVSVEAKQDKMRNSGDKVLDTSNGIV